MGKYKIFFKKSALKELENIPKPTLKRILKRIQGLPNNPKPVGSQKLSNYNIYRIRQGDYRIVYLTNNKNSNYKYSKLATEKKYINSNNLLSASVMYIEIPNFLR